MKPRQHTHTPYSQCVRLQPWSVWNQTQTAHTHTFQSVCETADMECVESNPDSTHTLQSVCETTEDLRVGHSQIILI